MDFCESQSRQSQVSVGLSQSERQTNKSKRAICWNGHALVPFTIMRLSGFIGDGDEHGAHGDCAVDHVQSSPAICDCRKTWIDMFLGPMYSDCHT